jgi:PAS domain S-box-containing protein
MKTKKAGVSSPPLASPLPHLTAKEREERLRFALDAADIGTWDWDQRTSSVNWSDNVERIHGLSPGTLDHTFQSYERQIHPEDRERVLASIQRALSDGVPHEVEYRIVGSDGTVRWVEAKGHVGHRSDGRAKRMTGVFMNVTPRKQAELARLEALEQSNGASQRVAAIVESSDDAIVSKSLDGVITSWNRAAERMFGYTESEAIGQHIRLIVPRNRHAEEDRVLTSIRAGEPVEMETVRRHKNGTSVAVSLMVSPVKDAGGRIVGASKIARDIGARKRDEAERAELHRRLTALVAASASLLDSPETESVRSATVSLARELLFADGYAMWGRESGEAAWHVVKSSGISAAFASRVIASYRGAAAPVTPLFSDPLPVSDVAAQPMLEEQLAAYREEGIGRCSSARCGSAPDDRGRSSSTIGRRVPSATWMSRRDSHWPTSQRPQSRRRICTSSCGSSATPPNPRGGKRRSWPMRRRSCRNRSITNRQWRLWRDSPSRKLRTGAPSTSSIPLDNCSGWRSPTSIRRKSSTLGPSSCGIPRIQRPAAAFTT